MLVVTSSAFSGFVRLVGEGILNHACRDLPCIVAASA
jgi:hypothetical protein